MALATAVLSTAFVGAAAAQYQEEEQQPKPAAAEVDANGNGFEPGSLNFDPAKVRVPVGGIVRWTNTDQFVPHTSTEDHGLWRLSGTYGSPGPFEGYGPGESVERAFEAGTHHYYCEVHPEDMRAVVEVPLTLKKRSGRRATATWTLSAPGEGLVFDVQRRVSGGRWRMVLRGTAKRRATFPRPRGKRLDVRARLRSSSEPKKATGWSPVASIRG